MIEAGVPAFYVFGGLEDDHVATLASTVGLWGIGAFLRYRN